MYKEYAQRILDGILAHSQVGDSGNSNQILALACVCNWVDGSKEKVWTRRLAELLGDIPVGYTSDTLLGGLLASRAMLELGPSKHLRGAAVYLEVLQSVDLRTCTPYQASVLALMTGRTFVPPASPVPQLPPPADTCALEDVFRQIEMATGFGTRAGCVAADTVLQRRIEGVAMRAMQERDLFLALRSLRVLAYLTDRSSLAITAGSHFIRAEQERNGCFDVQEIISQTVPDPDAAAYRAKLALALEGVWTLYELSDPSNRLFLNRAVPPRLQTVPHAHHPAA